MRAAVIHAPGDVRFVVGPFATSDNTAPTASAPTPCWSASAPRSPCGRPCTAPGPTRPGGNVGFVGVPHEAPLDGEELFDLALPLEQVAENYKAMDERRAVTPLLKP